MLSRPRFLFLCRLASVRATSKPWPSSLTTTETREGFDAAREWSRGFWSALQPHHTSVYVNFLMEEGEERVREAYGAAKYERLKALKRQYDPENFFRLNQNIPPG